MKKILSIIAILIVVNGGAQITSARLQASGLTCAMCSKAIYKALSAVPFVNKVHADIENTSYDLSFKPGAAVDFDALSKAVTDAGFSVSMFKVTTYFNEVAVQNDTHIILNHQNFHFIHVPAQTLQGEKTITFIDKNFVSAKAYKQYSRYTTMKCYETGFMANCCKPVTDKNAVSGSERIYHVTM